MRYLSAALLCVIAAAGAEVLAQVEDEDLTWEELVVMVGGEQNVSGLGITSEEMAEQVLDSWVDDQLLVMAAEAEGLDRDPEVAAALEMARRQILLEAYATRLLEDVQASQLQVENYVDQWLDTYRRKLRVRHIMVMDQQLATSLRSRIAGGESFEDLAMEHSLGGAYQNGGNLGWITRGESGLMAFDEAVFSMDEGELSPVIDAGGSYHIVEVLEEGTVSPEPAEEEVRQLVAIELSSEMQQQAIIDAAESLRDTYDVQLYPERLMDHL